MGLRNALRGVASCMLVALPLAIAAPAVADPADAPFVSDLQVVSTATATGDGGNAWGGHQPRVVRTAAGVFTAYSVPGRDGLHRLWRLAQETPDGWHVIARGASGREPPSLVASPGGALYVVAWPDGLPRLWTVTQQGDGWYVQEESVPGDWIRSDWPYGTAAIGPGGALYVLQSNDFEYGPGPMLGALRVATRTTFGGWSFQVTETPYRYCYAWLEPTPRGGLNVVATRAVLWRTLGYRRPRRAFAYVYDSVGTWRSDAPALAPLERGPTVRTERPSSAVPNVLVSAAQPDVYRDSAGRLHVLYTVRGPGTRGRVERRHAVLVGDRVVDDVRLPSWLGWGKVVEDAAGRIFVLGTATNSSTLYVYPTLSPDGTVLGQPTQLSLDGHGLEYPGFTVADPRSGTPRGDGIDVVYPSGARSRRWMHFTLTLP